ncbi:hypothetical protein MUK70_12770 [Dyadobacter chenwenxiniae]|uniref:Uncharacterized protein n=1 Tax=Dyadobacter chenwenxiniae TaxID=2906456 RepID=A0A9X1TBQ6_9BACT|nr:hypothetical protein [Dyadobacter chenwenxiniae]MCF0060116.1 hypothetical protein [Dyadobacter chenwenxiniae]UON85854.1 hypothetical protein MUK70_12770 [Dyadobacter chenwenxiniae]
MALGLKYFARYRDIDGVIKEVRFLKEGYGGPATEWFCLNGAVRYDYAGFDGMFEKPIIPSQARISLFLSQYYDLKDFVFNRKTYFCEIWHIEEGVINWSGWIEPWDARRPHRKPPWTVELTASCGLAHLAKKKYLNQTDQFKKTGLQIIKECLATIGVTQPIRISTHMVETTWGGDDRLGLNSFEIDVSRYYDNNGEAMYCDVIVNDILDHFTAEIVQEKNRWVIRSTVDNATGLATGYIDIDNPGAPADMPFTYSINGEGDSATMNDGNVRILPPINKYRTEIDFGTQAPFFLNGNMVLWNENGLVGWDFTHMNKSTTDGWERFEIGGEISRGVLKINGKSPQPYRKKKKKKFLQVLIPILTGMVGANLKNKYYDIEPTQYIESPGGTISRGDKSVTISFDYETDALASDILISIRIPIREFKSGKVNNFWVDPDQGVALAGADKTHRGATQEFQLIRIPPVDMGTLTNKGDLNVSSNPNYPAATWTPGSRDINWTWTATGVPAGEYRRVGGVNGVLVENGDLIVARVPNNGGSQAEVGGSWEIIGMRNNVKKGTFSITVAINTLIIAKAGDPWPADKIYVRFYKMADDQGLPGDWYKVYNLNGALEGFIAKEESAKYATVLQRGDVTDEEAKTINLISGDYNPWYAGSWTKPGSKENTRTWRRRPDLNEAMSVYRAMMLDRLSLTSRPLTVVEGVIKLAQGAPRLSYLHTLLMQDMGGIRMRLTRFSYNDYNRQITFSAIEVKYEEIPREELKQDSYIPGSRQLNTVPGEGDGIYPSKQDSTNGRLNAEDMALTDEELAAALEQGSRLSALFENIPPLIFTAGELSSDSVNLNNYLSEVVKYNNADQEEEDVYNFDDLRWLVTDKPSWVTNQSVVFLNVTVTGKPIYVGDYSITFKVGEQTSEEAQKTIDRAIAEAEANGEEYVPVPAFYIEVEIPIKVFPRTIITYELLDMSSGSPTVIGPLPGVYPVPAGKWDIRARIKGSHDWWQMSLFGGGDTGSDAPLTVSQNVLQTESGTYLMFEETGGIQTGPGQYRHFTTTQLSKVTVSRQDIVFTLYDEEFLASGRFFLRKGAVNIGEIALDGSSMFENPDGCDVVFVTGGVEHDEVDLRLLTKNQVVLTTKGFSLPDSANSGEYRVYGADTLNQIGKYIIEAYVYLNDNKIVSRFTDFELVKKKPEAKGGALALMGKVPGSLNFKQLAVLPKSGSEHLLPVAGFNVKTIGESSEFDWEGWTYQLVRGGQLNTVDISKYTGQPQFISYPNPVTESPLLLFGRLTSIQIDTIHEINTTHRAIVTRRLGGPTGEIAAILQADFSFGEFQDPDGVPDEDETDSLTDYLAGYGMFEEILDYKKVFGVRVDNIGIEINGPESPDNPAGGTPNNLRLKAKGVKFANIQDIPTKTVIGRMAGGTGVTSAIPVATIVTGADPGDLVTVEYIEELISASLAKYMPLTNVTTGNVIPNYFGDVNAYNFTGVALIGTGAANAPNAIPGMLIAGVSGSNVSQLVVTRSGDNSYYRGTNGGALGTWYQIASRAWVDLKEVNTGVGLLGGGPIATNLTLTFDTVWGDARYLVNASTGLPWTQVNVNTKPKFNVSAVDSPSGGSSSFHGIYIPHSTNADIGSTIAFRNGTAFFRSVESGVWGVWLAIADKPWVNAKQILGGDGMAAGSGGDLSANRVIDLGTPSTLDASTTNAVTTTSHTHEITTGSLVQGSNIVLSGTLTDRLIGAGNVTISATAIPWTIVTGKPTTLSGFGIVDGVTIGDFNIGLGTKENTFPKGNLVTGDNITFGGSGVNRLVGSGDLVIACNSMPWNDVTGKPTTVAGYGITDVYTKANVDSGLNGKENTFSKGNLVTGNNITFGGDPLSRLVGSGNLVIACNNMPWNDVTGKPTTIAGYGITDAYTESQVDSLLSGKANSSHTHTASQITDFTSAVRGSISGTGGISYNSSTGVITYSGSSGTVDGTGTKNRLAKWDTPGTGLLDSRIYDEGTGDVEILTGLRLSGGLTPQRMTRAARLALGDPGRVMIVFQTDTVSGSDSGLKLHYAAGFWVGIEEKIA